MARVGKDADSGVTVHGLKSQLPHFHTRQPRARGLGCSLGFYRGTFAILPHTHVWNLTQHRSHSTHSVASLSTVHPGNWAQSLEAIREEASSPPPTPSPRKTLTPLSRPPWRGPSPTPPSAGHCLSSGPLFSPKSSYRLLCGSPSLHSHRSAFQTPSF